MGVLICTQLETIVRTEIFWGGYILGSLSTRVSSTLHEARNAHVPNTPRYMKASRSTSM